METAPLDLVALAQAIGPMGSVVLALVWFFLREKSQSSALADSLSALSKAIAELQNAMTRQTETLIALSHDVRELRRDVDNLRK